MFYFSYRSYHFSPCPFCIMTAILSTNAPWSLFCPCSFFRTVGTIFQHSFCSMTAVLSSKFTVVAILSTILFNHGRHFVDDPFEPWPPFCPRSFWTVAAILSTILLNQGRHFAHDPFEPWPPFCPRMTIPSPFPPGNMPDVKACLFAHANECIIPASQFYRGGICQELDEYSERGVLFSFL
jgi:hypothetical protein